MSHAPEVTVEPEVLPSVKLLTILVFGASVVVVSAVIVLWILPSRLAVETGAITGRPEHVGTLQTSLLAVTHTTEQDKQRDRASLEGYKWVDKNRGIVAIPIERAMDMLVEQNP